MLTSESDPTRNILPSSPAYLFHCLAGDENPPFWYLILHTETLLEPVAVIFAWDKHLVLESSLLCHLLMAQHFRLRLHLHWSVNQIGLCNTDRKAG